MTLHPGLCTHYRPAGGAGWPRVAEPAGGPISEAQLSTIWEGQRYPPGALRGADGLPLEVVYPGRKGGGAGPDFRDAVIRSGGLERRGDVEIHVRASYYLQHGHQFDPAYDRLVLHVAFLDDAGGASPLPGGGRVPVASFAGWVRERAADIASWVRAPPLWREPCQDAAARLGDEGVDEALAMAARERFRSRARLLAEAAAAEGPDQALWNALMEALGYGGDREGFRRLAAAIPAALLARTLAREGEAAVLGLLLAAAGLAGPHEGAPPALVALRRTSARPGNRPEARLRAAAGLIAACGGRPAAFALKSVETSEAAGPLLARWSPPSLGRSRATELLLNAVLPFAAGQAPALEARCLEIGAQLRPLSPYGKTLFLERNLARPDGKRRPRSALDQQGLLAMHARWCSQGGCGRCPLS